MSDSDIDRMNEWMAQPDMRGEQINHQVDVLAVMDRTAAGIHRVNVPEMLAARAAVEELIDALCTANQALAEVQHAQSAGPSWYTKGEDGMFTHIYGWVRKARDAATFALARCGH